MKDLVPVKSSAQPLVPADYASMAPMGDFGAPSSNLRTKRLLAFVKRFWWLPCITTFCALCVGVAVALWAPATFVSKARMWETEKLRLPDSATFTSDLQNYYGTQMEVLQSDSLKELTLKSLKDSGKNAVPLGADGNPLEVKITARQAPKSTVFFLQASSANAAFSQVFLEELMARYLSYKKGVRAESSLDTYNSISEQLQRLDREVKDGQETFTAYQRTNNIAIMQEEGTISGAYLARLKTQISDLQLESKLLEATTLEQESAINNTNSAGFLLESIRFSSTGGSPMAAADRQAALKELEVLKMQRTKLSKYLKPKHPKIMKLDADIERGYKIVELYRNQNRDQLAAARQAINMRIESVQASIKEWESKVVDSKNRLAEAERLKLAFTRSQVVRDVLADTLRRVDISRNIEQDSLAVLDRASPAERSYKQQITIVGLAAFLGLAAGLGLIMFIEIRDDRFTTLSEVTDKFGDSIIGQVPEMRALRKEKRPALLHDANEPHILAESYRNLRSALLFFAAEAQPPKVLLITSPVPNEGKSTVAANLARTFAQGGSRVLLVDADLRKGTLHHVLGLRREPGLANLLSNGFIDPARYFQEVPLDVLRSEDSGQRTQELHPPSSTLHPRGSLFFLSRGADLKNPGDAFLSRELTQALATWREQFDMVIIDSCPVFAADDAAVLAPKVDGALLVVRRGFSRLGVTREALDLLLLRQAKVFGFVFNRADAASHSYYYYKHGEYAHGGKGGSSSQ